MYPICKELIVEKQEKILVIKFSNPKKKNSLNRVAYTEIGKVFRAAAKDDNITIVVITGVGDYFTSGNDLSPQDTNFDDMEGMLKESNEIFMEMVRSVVDCPKAVIALVNGPSIGIGATLSALCDVVWCSENAYFLTPFTRLGLCPEACASYVFPLLFGRSKASEMLLFSEPLKAQEAYAYNFVSRIFKLSELDTVIWPKIREWSQLPPGSLKVTKELIRMPEKVALHKALEAECAALAERTRSEEFFNAIMQFAMRKKKQSNL